MSKKFVSDSLAQIMREIIIERMNKQTGWSETAGADNEGKVVTAEHFYDAQLDASICREAAEYIYNRQTFKPGAEVVSIGHIGMAIYELIVVMGANPSQKMLRRKTTWIMGKAKEYERKSNGNR